MKLYKKIIIFILAFGLANISLLAWDDLDLLSAGSNYSLLKPNVMILMDNSGSMNHIIFPASYNQETSYGGPSCDLVRPGSAYRILRDGNIYYMRNDNTYSYRLNGTAHSLVYTLDVPDCDGGGGYTPNQNVHFFVEYYNNQQIRVPGNLLQFLVYHATPEEVAVWNHFQIYGKWDTTDFVREDFRKVRIRAAAEALKGVIADIYAEYDADINPGKAYPRIGVTLFDGGSNGGNITSDCQTYSSQAAYNAMINGVAANTWTPLSETYAETWAYFRHGGSCSITSDRYYYPMDNAGVANISANTPITHWCQANFIIIMTDGEPTQDLELRNLSDDTLFSISADGSADWGDVIENDDDTATLPSSGSNYLDDLAYFAYENDLWPDEMSTISSDGRFEDLFQNKQFIYTYTIGFTIDNQLLQDTATNGKGEYFTATDYDTLVQAMNAVFSSIDEKVTAFAAFAAPKHSLTHGKRGYIATFIPRANKARWEGYFKGYILDAEGEFTINSDGDAINEIWDVKDRLELRSYSGNGGSFGTSAGTGDRTIFTWFDRNREMFVAGNTDITHDILGVTPGDDVTRTQIFDVVRGKTNPYEYKSKFGDVFHFDPKVSTPAWRILSYFYESYLPFYETYKDREEVIFVGANDGMLHCFEVNEGNELWGFIPPSVLGELKTIGLNDDHDYFVDGQGTIRDIQVYDSGTFADWQTLLVFGQGLGGESYYGMDITRPKSDPVVKWQFGTETMDNGNTGKTVVNTPSGSTVVSNQAILGYSMAIPSVGPIKYLNVASDTTSAFSAVVLPGGYDEDELTPISAGGNYKGKSLAILNADTGEVVKLFAYGTGDSNSSTNWTSPQFLYAMVAEPILVDYNNDSYYDAIYQADIGGRIWKVDISSNNRVNWRPYIIFDTDAAITEGISSQPIFVAPTVGYDDEYNVWLFFGTGYRPNPQNLGTTGKFYTFKDEFVYGDSPYTPDDLQDISTEFGNNSDNTDSDFDGYPDSQEISEGTDPNDSSDYPVWGAPSGRLSVSNPKGFYFSFQMDSGSNGEKLFSPSPIYIGGNVIFNTYVPPHSAIQELCDPAGDLYVYRFKFDVTDGVVSLDSPDISKGRILGSGLLTGDTYKIYVGEGEIGSQSIQAQQGLKVEQSYGLMFFRENKTKVFK